MKYSEEIYELCREHLNLDTYDTSRDDYIDGLSKDTIMRYICAEIFGEADEYQNFRYYLGLVGLKIVDK